jgi:hypothetical protein
VSFWCPKWDYGVTSEILVPQVIFRCYKYDLVSQVRFWYRNKRHFGDTSYILVSQVRFWHHKWDFGSTSDILVSQVRFWHHKWDFGSTSDILVSQVIVGCHKWDFSVKSDIMVSQVRFRCHKWDLGVTSKISVSPVRSRCPIMRVLCHNCDVYMTSGSKNIFKRAIYDGNSRSRVYKWDLAVASEFEENS